MLFITFDIKSQIERLSYFYRVHESLQIYYFKMKSLKLKHYNNNYYKDYCIYFNVIYKLLFPASD